MRDVRAGDISRVCVAALKTDMRKCIRAIFSSARQNEFGGTTRFVAPKRSVWTRRTRSDLAQWRGSGGISSKLLWMVHRVSKTKTCIFYRSRVWPTFLSRWWDIKYYICSPFSSRCVVSYSSHSKRLKRIHRVTRGPAQGSPAIIYELRLDDLKRISRILFANGILLLAGQTMRPEARHRPPESLVFLLKRRERSRVAAERIGGGYIFSLPFCSQGTLVLSHEIPDIFLSLLFSSICPRMLFRAARKTCATWYGFILSRGPVLSRSRVFTFSTKSPRLCTSLLRLPTKWCH